MSVSVTGTCARAGPESFVTVALSFAFVAVELESLLGITQVSEHEAGPGKARMSAGVQRVCQEQREVIHSSLV